MYTYGNIIIQLYYFVRAMELIQDLKNRMVRSSQDDTFTLRLLLAEWTRVCRHSMSSNALYTHFAEKVK